MMGFEKTPVASSCMEDEVCAVTGLDVTLPQEEGQPGEGLFFLPQRGWNPSLYGAHF